MPVLLDTFRTPGVLLCGFLVSFLCFSITSKHYYWWDKIVKQTNFFDKDSVAGYEFILSLRAIHTTTLVRFHPQPQSFNISVNIHIIYQISKAVTTKKQFQKERTHNIKERHISWYCFCFSWSRQYLHF